MFISLGGFGGCSISESLSSLNLDKGRSPFDWIHSTQDFVISVFNDKNNYFIFEEKYVVGGYLVNDKLNGLILHDFVNLKDFKLKKQKLMEKYNRRLKRLLNNKDNCIFVRYLISNDGEAYNIFDEPKPIIFKAKKDDINKWVNFMKMYKNSSIILITNNINNFNSYKESDNVFLYEGENSKEDISKIIIKHLVMVDKYNLL